MLVEIETPEGEGLPVELMRDDVVEVVIVKRTNIGSVLECVRLTETPFVAPYVNPNTFILEYRQCHVWQVTSTYKEYDANTMNVNVPVDDVLHGPEHIDTKQYEVYHGEQ